MPSSPPLPASPAPGLMSVREFDEDDLEISSTPRRRKIPVQGFNDEITTFHVVAVQELDEYMLSSPPSLPSPKYNSNGDISMSKPKHCETAFGAYKFNSNFSNASALYDIADTDTYMPSSPPLVPQPNFDEKDFDMDISMSTPKRSKIPIALSKISTTSSTAQLEDTDTYMPSSPPLPVRPDATAYDFTMTSPLRLNTTINPSTSTINNSTTNYPYSRATTVQDSNAEEDFDTMFARENPPPPPSDTEAATDVDADLPSSPPARQTLIQSGRVRVRVRNNHISIYKDDSATEAATDTEDTPSLASTRGPHETTDRREEPPIPPSSIFQVTHHDDTSSAQRFEILCDNPGDGPAFGYEPVVNRRRGRPDDWIREEEISRVTRLANRRVSAGGLGGGNAFGVYQDESSEEDEGGEQEQTQRGTDMRRSPERFRR